MAAPKVDFGSTTASEAAFIKTAVALENTGVGAYSGQVLNITNPAYVAAAASILTVEARHASVAGLLLKPTSKNLSPDGAFDKPKTAAQVLKAVEATGFLRSHPPGAAKSILRIGFAGAPAAIVPASRSRVTTELAPITQRSPTLTPLVTAQLTPNQQLAPIFTGPLRGEALPGDRLLGVVVAVLGVADEAAVGEHRVVADLDPLLRGDHHVAVEEAARADLDPGPRRQGQPAARLEQRPLADRQPPLVERLQHLALDRVADEEAAARGVAVDPPAPQQPLVALIPAPLLPPDPPAARCHPGTLCHRRSS